MNFREKVFREYECPTCKSTGCYSHCNHCGINIKWLNHLGDPYYETNQNGRRVRLAYEPDYSIHRCMQKGTKDGKFYNKNEPNEYILDEHRKIYRLGNTPVFKCSFCNKKGDLPVMIDHHTNEKQFDCTDKLMEKFFKEKPKTFINTKDYRLSDFK